MRLITAASLVLLRGLLGPSSISFAVAADTGAGTTAASAGTDVSGSVLDPMGRLIAGATVWLQLRPTNKGPAPAPFSRWVRTEADGRFRFSGVPAGSFTVCIQVPRSDLLDPCQWDTKPPSVTVASAPVTLQPISLGRGFPLRVRLDDPKETIDSRPPGSKGPPSMPVMLGVWKPGGEHVPFRLAYQDKYGQEFELVVPYHTPLRLSLYSRKLALTDNRGAALDAGQGANVPIVILPGKEPAMLRFTVQGRLN